MNAKIQGNNRGRLLLPLIFAGCFLLCSPGAGAQQPFGDARKGGRDENDKMAMRSVLQVTKLSRQPLIEIELYSDRTFPGLNAAVVLIIGDKVFHGGGFKTDNHVLSFRVKPQEFAKTKNGDKVTVAYEGFDPNKVSDEDIENNPNIRVWRFGKLDKSKIDQ